MSFFVYFYQSAEVPGKPGTPVVSDIGATTATVTWTPPQSDGGSRITGYIVEMKETMSTRWVKSTKESFELTHLTVENLTEGREYEFRVSACNMAGTGQPSDLSKTFKAKPPYGK